MYLHFFACFIQHIMPFLRLTLGPLYMNYQSKTLLNTSYNTPSNLLSYTVKNRDLLYWQTNYQVHWTKNWYTMSVREKKFKCRSTQHPAICRYLDYSSSLTFGTSINMILAIRGLMKNSKYYIFSGFFF